ncbi:MAG: choice-of-anchor Q domain-containing protein [Thermomicrobiales bacterium]
MKGALHEHSRRVVRVGLVMSLLALFLVAVPAPSVGAATITVDSLGDGPGSAGNCATGHAAGTCRLRDAIVAAAANDTITFSVSGTIAIIATIGLIRNVTIQGPGAASLIIDGGCMGCGPNGTPSGGREVFLMIAGVTATISGLTIQHGYAASGGGISNAGTLTIANCAITENGAFGGSLFSGGGGILNDHGSLTVTGSTFTNDFTFHGYIGGGILNDFGTLMVTNTILTNNSSGDSSGRGTGGGINNEGGMATVTSDTFTGNFAGFEGGAIENAGAIDNSVLKNGILAVTNSTFTGNSALDGGAIENLSSTDTTSVTGGSFTNNTALGGGAIDSFGPLTVTGATFSGNTSTGAGNGGGAISASLPTVTSSIFTGNMSTSADGGAMLLNGGTVTNSIFMNNTAHTTGGGIQNSSTLTVTGSAFIGNSAPLGGGGLFENTSGTPIIASSTFTGNSATGSNGGGIKSIGGLTLTNSTLSGNSAATGGGLYVSSPGALTATVTNSTIANNSATTGGGGFQNDNGPASITNTIVASNTGGNCGVRLTFSVITDGGHNIQFGDNSCGATITVADPLLGPLADNGGATMLPDGSHLKTPALKPGSPAVDAGSDTVCNQTGVGKVNMLDERGIHRPQGAHCDIGAYELLPSPLPPAQPTASLLILTPRPLPPTQVPAPTVVATPMPLPPRRP